MSIVPQLPNEIVEAILLRLLPHPDSKESVRTLCRVGQANSRFLAVSRLSHIWEPHCAVQWKRSDASREEIRKATTRGDWWLMYAARCRIDRRALDLLDTIIARRDGREFLAVELTKDLGYDAWEAVSQRTSRVRHRAIMDKDTRDMIDVPTEGLTRQYWGHEILGVISRVRAIDIWKPLTDPFERGVSFEQGLAALSAFFGEDIHKIPEEFDRLAVSCQVYLSSLPEPADQTETILRICAWMRREGFVKTDLTDFHNLSNHFPHRVLFEQPRTLPISLVYVFVCIARRLGLDAFPVGFPHRVLAVVSPPVGQPIYVDVFDSATRPILSYSSDLPAMLQQLGIDPETLAQQVTPSPTNLMVLRAAGNIVNSLQMMMAWSEGDQLAAHYAAYCAMLLLTRDARVVPALFVVGVGGPLDHEVIFKRALRPNLSPTAKERLDICLAKQAETEKIECKSAGRRDVLHFTGMIFRHRKYPYIGLIKSWDYQCEAGDEWIHSMGVDELPRGKTQPFYPSYTSDGHTRYVAEENIEPIGRPTASDVRLLIEANRGLGRWFDGVEFTASGASRFVMSPEAHALHPEDDAAGRTFVTQHD